MSTNLPAVRSGGLSEYHIGRVQACAADIRAHVRISSVKLTTACRQRGLPLELAELCAGVLASVLDDLGAIGRLRKSDLERSIRMEAVLAATEEPAASALRLAVAASPVNGRAAVRHWDMVCEKGERGKFAWLLGLDTDSADRYRRKLEHKTP